METDKGSSDQAKTPFNVDQTHLTYNISLTQIAVDENITKISTNVIFYSGTSFIYLIDLAYSVMVENVFILQIFTPAPSATLCSVCLLLMYRG